MSEHRTASELTAAMAAYLDEQSRAAPPPFEAVRARARRQRRRRRLAVAAPVVAAAVAVAAVVVAVSGATPRPPTPAGPPSCPASVTPRNDLTMPATPPKATGRVDAGARLVPREVPREALICAYRPTDDGTSAVPLTGRVRLPEASLPALAEDLSYLPRYSGEQFGCLTIGGRRQVTYLVGLGYGDATVWVATSVHPRSCVHTTNGSFRSRTYVGHQVDAAFKAGTWAPPAPRFGGGGGTCHPPRAGRLGQERVLVPGRPIAVDVCYESPAEVVTATDGVADLAAAFNRLPTTRSRNSCSAPRGHFSPSYVVVFRYADGPPVVVRVDTWCDPPINNESLQSPDDTTVVPLLQQLRSRHAPG